MLVKFIQRISDNRHQRLFITAYYIIFFSSALQCPQMSRNILPDFSVIYICTRQVHRKKVAVNKLFVCLKLFLLYNIDRFQISFVPVGHENRKPAVMGSLTQYYDGNRLCLSDLSIKFDKTSSCVEEDYKLVFKNMKCHFQMAHRKDIKVNSIFRKWQQTIL